MWGLLWLACAAYFLPWIWNPAAALSPNAYDLAEWTTLHPEARHATPPLLPSFLLRSALGFLTVLTILPSSPANSKWLGRALTLGLIIVMLPPAEFFLLARGDPNYSQQFYLSGFTLVLVFVATFGVNRLPTPMQKMLCVLLTGLGIIAGLWGLVLAMNIYTTFGIGNTVGIGGTLFCGLLLVYGAGVGLELVKQ